MGGLPFELALKFLSNPWKLWTNGDITLRNTVLRLAFAERMAYSRNEGFRTPQVTEPFRFLGFSTSEKELVRLEGETSNALFEELAEWNEHLKGKNIDFRGPKP